MKTITEKEFRELPEFTREKIDVPIFNESEYLSSDVSISIDTVGELQDLLEINKINTIRRFRIGDISHAKQCENLKQGDKVFFIEQNFLKSIPHPSNSRRKITLVVSEAIIKG